MTGLSDQVDAIQDRWTVVVGEIDVSKFDSALDGLGRPRIGVVADVRFGVEDVEDPLCGGRGSDDGVVDTREAFDGAVEAPEIVLEERTTSRC